MNYCTIISIILLSFFVFILDAKEYNDRTNEKITEIEKNEWTLLEYADSQSVLLVNWKEIYGGERSAYCKAVFVHKNGELKLVAPWFKNNILYTSNLIYRNVIELTKDQIPKELLPYLK